VWSPCIVFALLRASLLSSIFRALLLLLFSVMFEWSIFDHWFLKICSFTGALSGRHIQLFFNIAILVTTLVWNCILCTLSTSTILIIDWQSCQLTWFMHHGLCLVWLIGQLVVCFSCLLLFRYCSEFVCLQTSCVFHCVLCNRLTGMCPLFCSSPSSDLYWAGFDIS